MARSGYSFIPPHLTGGSAAPKDRLLNGKDFVRESGKWAERPTVATIVQIALSIHLGESPSDPDHGTSIPERMRRGDPVSLEEIQAETARVLIDLEERGLIAEVSVAVVDDEGQAFSDTQGRDVVLTRFRDLVAGSASSLTIGADFFS